MFESPDHHPEKEPTRKYSPETWCKRNKKIKNNLSRYSLPLRGGETNPEAPTPSDQSPQPGGKSSSKIENPDPSGALSFRSKPAQNRAKVFKSDRNSLKTNQKLQKAKKRCNYLLNKRLHQYTPPNT